MHNVTLYTVQVWWREVPDSGDGSSSLLNNVTGYTRDGDHLTLSKANGDTTILNLQSTQLVNIMEKRQ